MITVTSLLITTEQLRHVLDRMEVKNFDVQEHILQIKHVDQKSLINVLNGFFFDVCTDECPKLCRMNMTLNDLNFGTLVGILNQVYPSCFSVR